VLGNKNSAEIRNVVGEKEDVDENCNYGWWQRDEDS